MQDSSGHLRKPSEYDLQAAEATQATHVVCLGQGESAFLQAFAHLWAMCFEGS